jgi:hypothetical protein
MGERTFRIPVGDRDIEKKIAILLCTAEQENVDLPHDVAVYLAHNVRPNPGALKDVLLRLIAFSSVMGTNITLSFAKTILERFIAWQERAATVDPFQKMAFAPLEAKEAGRTRPAPTVTDLGFVLCLPKMREKQQMSRVRKQLEVNIRERERDLLARLDVYERTLERLVKTRKRG